MKSLKPIFLLNFAIILSCFACKATKSSIKPLTFQEEVMAFRKDLNQKYSKAATSPLPPEMRSDFKGHHFYPIDKSYQLTAKFIKTENAKAFKMKTSTDRLPEYIKYGVLLFDLDDQQHQLSLYQNISLAKVGQYKDYLFLPFKDTTNGEQTYGGGRYIDFKIPTNDVVILDFNKSYNPYCAYSDKFSCPIPPNENHLPIAIPAGIKKYK